VKKKVNSRAKGSAGERELINEMEGWLGPWVKQQVKRNLEQTRNGGHDLIGLGRWALECKRYKEATESDIEGWWHQAVAQAHLVGKTPVLAYRLDRRSWRVRIPTRELLAWLGNWDIEWTAEITLQAFCAILNEELSEEALRGKMSTGSEANEKKGDPEGSPVSVTPLEIASDVSVQPSVHAGSF